MPNELHTTRERLGSIPLNVFAKTESDKFIPGESTFLADDNASSCGIDLTEGLFVGLESEEGDESNSTIRCDFSKPFQDWYDMALQVEPVIVPPVRNSWGDDDEEGDEELPDDDADDEEPDPFEDFDEDDFDDDFDDDFEEELEDEYEIEPADDGLVTEIDDDIVLDEEIIDPDADVEVEVEPDLEEDVE